MYCDRCGSENRVLAVYCVNCGILLNVPSTGQQFGSCQPGAGVTVRNSYFERFRTAIDDRYSVLEELGRGGMAVVFLAEDRWLDRKVAMKLLPEEYQHDDGFRDRFLREAKIAARLSHPNIVQIHDVHSTGDFTYIAMSYIEGSSLARIIQKNTNLSPRIIAWIGMQICFALRHAHEHGVVHRDIKPENILIDRKRKPVVLDFGIAKAKTDSKLSFAGMLVGTPQYMSPEQIKTGEVDARSDIYSLGCVLYEMATRRPPFQGKEPTAIMYNHVNEMPLPPELLNDRIPPELSRIIMKTLAKDPANRFQTASLLGKALHEVFSGNSLNGIPSMKFLSVDNSSFSQKPGNQDIISKTLMPRSERFPSRQGQPAEDDKTISETMALPVSKIHQDSLIPMKTASNRLPRSYLKFNRIGTIAAAILGVVFILYLPVGWTLRPSEKINPESPLSAGMEASLKTPVRMASLSSPAVETVPEPNVQPMISENSGEISWVSIPGGAFTMGDAAGDADARSLARPAHRMNVPAFELSRFEITMEQYAQFLKQTSHPLPDQWEKQLADPQRPVVFVSWSDASSFAEWAGARLPTESEWEYAARGGLERMPYPWGNAEPGTRSNFGHDWNSGNGWTAALSRPGSFPPNRFGLSDMAGNVWEWCDDWFKPYDTPGTVRAAGIDSAGNARVLRGGAWNSSGQQIRVDTRSSLAPNGKNSNIGFRIARDIPAP